MRLIDDVAGVVRIVLVLRLVPEEARRRRPPSMELLSRHARRKVRGDTATTKVRAVSSRRRRIFFVACVDTGEGGKGVRSVDCSDHVIDGSAVKERWDRTVRRRTYT